MKRFLLFVLLAILLALAFPQPALALGEAFQDTTQFEVGLTAFGVALAGFLTYQIMNGLKLKIEGLEGAMATFFSILTGLLTSFLTGVISTNIDPTFWPLLGQAFLVGAVILSAWGFKYLEKRLRPPTVMIEPAYLEERVGGISGIG